MKRTPLIILNGFLGAGKTTLLKNLLTQAHKRRMTVSVIVNDMSELDVDGVLIAGNDSNLLIVFYVQIMPDDFVMQLHRF